MGGQRERGRGVHSPALSPWVAFQEHHLRQPLLKLATLSRNRTAPPLDSSGLAGHSSQLGLGPWLLQHLWLAFLHPSHTFINNSSVKLSSVAPFQCTVSCPSIYVRFSVCFLGNTFASILCTGQYTMGDKLFLKDLFISLLLLMKAHVYHPRTQFTQSLSTITRDPKSVIYCYLEAFKLLSPSELTLALCPNLPCCNLRPCMYRFFGKAVYFSQQAQHVQGIDKKDFAKTSHGARRNWKEQFHCWKAKV